MYLSNNYGTCIDNERKLCKILSIRYQARVYAGQDLSDDREVLVRIPFQSWPCKSFSWCFLVQNLGVRFDPTLFK